MISSYIFRVVHGLSKPGAGDFGVLKISVYKYVDTFAILHLLTTEKQIVATLQNKSAIIVER